MVIDLLPLISRIKNKLMKFSEKCAHEIYASKYESVYQFNLDFIAVLFKPYWVEVTEEL